MKQIVLAGLIALIGMGCGSKKEMTDSNAAETQTQNRSDRNNNRGDRKAPPSVDEIFKMDVDSDGFLSKSEVKGRLLEDFEKFDTDGNGLISRAEFENAPRPERKRRGGGQRNR